MPAALGLPAHEPDGRAVADKGDVAGRCRGLAGVGAADAVSELHGGAGVGGAGVIINDGYFFYFVRL